jgi:hypothetical protein
MPSQLRKIVEKKKSALYAWPAGWLSREQAANDLGCPPRDVDAELREAIRDGDVEKRFFPVWDAKQSRVVREPGYRVADSSTPAPSVKSSSSLAGDFIPLGTKVARRDNPKSQGIIQSDGGILWSNGTVSHPAPNTWRKNIVVVSG